MHKLSEILWAWLRRGGRVVETTSVTEMTRAESAVVNKAIAKFAKTPGMTIGDLTRMLDPAFGSVRAEIIAVTETTRAYNAKVNEEQKQLNTTGLQMRRIWGTANDDIVCFSCGPLNGLPEDEWKGEYPEGPPAHPGCRCFLSLTAQDDEVVIPDAIERAQERLSMLRKLGREAEARVTEARIAELRKRICNA